MTCLQISVEKIQQSATRVINIEIAAIETLSKRIDHNFVQACSHILACSGRVIVLGMGKSGHIGRKIAATLASTGTPAFFVHPGEASHGDMGMLTHQDIVLAISKSGETNEILVLLPIIKHLNIPLITFTGNPHSTLAQKAIVNIDISIPEESAHSVWLPPPVPLPPL